MIALAEAGLIVNELSPKFVKKTVTGYGSASKEQIKLMIEKLLGMPEQAQIIWQPDNFVKINDEKKATSILKLLETLDNCEDVQGVYSNFDIEDEIINKINI